MDSDTRQAGSDVGNTRHIQTTSSRCNSGLSHQFERVEEVLRSLFAGANPAAFITFELIMLATAERTDSSHIKTNKQTQTHMSDTPKIYINSTLGFKVAVRVPFSTTEEYDRLAGNVGAWWDDLAAQACYSSYNPEFYDRLGKAITDFTGVSIPDSNQKDAKGNAIPITTKAFIRQLKAESKITDEVLNELAAKVAEGMSVLDISPRGRASAKAGKQALQQARQLMAMLAGKGITVEDWFASYSAKYPGGPEASEDTPIDDNLVGRMLEHIAACKTGELLSV